MTTPAPDDPPTFDAEIVAEFLGNYNRLISQALAPWLAMTPEQVAEVRRFTRGSDDQSEV